MPRRIIINADDLGLSPSVNTAIFEVFRAGNLSSATLMVDMPGTNDAVQRLKDHPGLAVGLHFCLTEGRALTGHSSITDRQGAFMPRPSLVKAVLRGQVRTADVRAELEAQLARMVQWGVRPSHVDSHQHVHMLPAVLEAMLPVLEREGLPVRLVDPPSGAVRASLSRPRKALKQWLNQRFAALARRRTKLPFNDVLVSIHDLDHDGPYDAATYQALVEATPPDALVELMVHPYVLGEDVLALYASDPQAKRPFLDRCVAEYEALRGAPVLGDVVLLNYAGL